MDIALRFTDKSKTDPKEYLTQYIQVQIKYLLIKKYSLSGEHVSYVSARKYLQADWWQYTFFADTSAKSTIPPVSHFPENPREALFNPQELSQNEK